MQEVHLIFVLGLMLILLIGGGGVSPSAAAAEESDIWRWICDDSDGNYTADSPYKSKLDALLTNITTLDIPYGFYNFSVGEDPDDVSAIGMCRGDVVGVAECHSCLIALRSKLASSCPTEVEAVAWAEKCMLRYSPDDILGKFLNGRYVDLGTKVDAGGDKQHFAQVVEDLLMSLPNKTAEGDYRKKFATGEAVVNTSHTVYALMQCTPDLKAYDCLGCLYYNMGVLVNATNRGQTGGRLLGRSCTIRYELYRFYVEPPSKATSGLSINLKTTIIVLASVLAATLSLLGVFIIWIFPRAPEEKEMNRKAKNFKPLEMDLSIIKDATRSFSDKNQLGRGGVSRVYKGKLHGKKIAVKRIKGSRYLSSDDINRAKLQHTNLVELLGVCLKGREKYLVFEYVSRGSLDQILFDPEHFQERAQLDWEKRYEIIQGIAQGLLYLHEKCGEKIVHCDLNAANVLIDKNWKPKITDFGVAKFLKSGETRDVSKPVSVFGSMVVGEMAPEYLKSGIISEKLDVYSFGILVLEILAGRRAKALNHEDLISLAWRKWRDGAVMEIVHDKIKRTSDLSEKEMKRCIHIALLCLQENEEERCNMSYVVEKLTSLSSELDQPSVPESIQKTWKRSFKKLTLVRKLTSLRNV